MFLQVFVIPSTGEGACMAWGVHGRGHVWWGCVCVVEVCMVGCMEGGSCVADESVHENAS